ncbi:hypothetical protein AV521_43760 [Streptomyces sp. IMTB 2501]|nr:hypothetical protein AV521_43760 [Streptomyces sp. IMTB 2501]
MLTDPYVVLRVFRLVILIGSVSACVLPGTPERRYRCPGRRRVPDPAALAGVMFELRTGVAWRGVPADTVGRPGVTAWRRLWDWAEDGGPRLAVRPVDLDHGNAVRGEEPGGFGAVSAGSVDPRQRGRAERAQPLQQPLVALGGGLERLGWPGDGRCRR